MPLDGLEKIAIDAETLHFGAKSYPLDQITAIEVRTLSYGEQAWMLFLTAALAFGAIALADLADGKQSDATQLFVVGLIFAVLTALFFRKPLRRSYKLVLETAAGETDYARSSESRIITYWYEKISSAVRQASQ